MSTKTRIRVFKGPSQSEHNSDAMEKSLDQRIIESCCSFHIGIADLAGSDKPFKYVMTGNGVVKVINNKIGTFVVQAKDVPGLVKINEGLVFNLPKIPYNHLLATISFFRRVMKEYQNAEAMVQFYFDEAANKYIMYCPEQEVSGTSIKFKRSQDMDDNYLLVMDIHSHNTMGAYFSTIDDKDEKETRIFGVIGKLNNNTPEMKFRISASGAFKEIDIFDIFENPYGDISFPEEWMEKVNPPKVKVYNTNTYPLTTYLGGASSRPYGSKYSSYYGLDDEDDWNSAFVDGGVSTYRSGRKVTYDIAMDAIDVATLDVESVNDDSLVDLVKDIIVKDPDIVLKAIKEEKMDDDFIDYLVKSKYR